MTIHCHKETVAHRSVIVPFETATGKCMNERVSWGKQKDEGKPTGKINGNPVRRTELVVPSVSFSNGDARVIHPREYSGFSQFSSLTHTPK